MCIPARVFMLWLRRGGYPSKSTALDRLRLFSRPESWRKAEIFTPSRSSGRGPLRKYFSKGLRSQFWQAKVIRLPYTHIRHSRLDGYSCIADNTLVTIRSQTNALHAGLEVQSTDNTHTHIKPSVPSATSFLRRGTQTHTTTAPLRDRLRAHAHQHHAAHAARAPHRAHTRSPAPTGRQRRC